MDCPAYRPSYIHIHVRRSRRPLPFLLGCCALLGSLALLPLFLAAARSNYPGGVALEAFHQHVLSTPAAADRCVRVCSLAMWLIEDDGIVSCETKRPVNNSLSKRSPFPPTTHTPT